MMERCCGSAGRVLYSIEPASARARRDGRCASVIAGCLALLLLLAGCQGKPAGGGPGPGSGGGPGTPPIIDPGTPPNPPPPATPISLEGLEGFWPLDGDWNDARGNYSLTPTGATGFSPSPVAAGNNRAYGPTGSTTGNGARNATLGPIDLARGLTLEGWAFLPDESSSGVLFGFGNGWAEAQLNISAGWGFLWVNLGKMGDGATVRYGRYGDQCWHHYALVLPPGVQEGAPYHFYVDGNEATLELIDLTKTGTAQLQNATLFGSAFRIGEFDNSGTSPSSGKMKVDQVRLWSRALTSAEVGLLATPGGSGALCANPALPDWAPSARCVPPAVAPVVVPDLGLRLIDDRTLVVVTDPNPWLKGRVAAECGTFLAAMEANKSLVLPYLFQQHYSYAIKETLLRYRPGLLTALGSPTHYTVTEAGGVPALPLQANLWPQAVREFHLPSVAAGGAEVHTESAENVYFSYLTLATPMQRGRTYTVSDPWGHSASILFDEETTLSWAFKTNQLGYLPDALEKYAYLGAWLGPQGGALDLTRFDGQPFEVHRESDRATVFTGTIALRGDDRLLGGEMVYQLDFSPLATPGRYYLWVAGLGRSRSFEIGQNAMGEAFYTHARGFYHQRCGTSLTAPYTAWTRGDLHTTVRRAAFPPEVDDYQDHTAEGWGFRDQNGAFPTFGYGHFDVVRYTATDQVVPGLQGGWHDAADFDHPNHLSAVGDLVHTWLMYPQNFSDGQLNIPESGNGVPDLLDEAAWGADLWRRAQEADGRVSLWIEATSHPFIPDPGQDTQPYYLGLATHNSSLQYAAYAALMGRALTQAGDSVRGQLFVDSARRAYAYGIDPGPRSVVSFSMDDGTLVTWSERPTVEQRRVFYALVQLALATGDPLYRTALDAPEMDLALQGEIDALYWRTIPYDLMDIALNPAAFPVGWSDRVTQALVANGDAWLAEQATHAYRKLWHATTHGYFGLMAWGANGFAHLRDLIAAWRVSGAPRFRTGALLAVDWMHGANPQGRVHTTGLGQYNAVAPLHLPSDVDGIADPVPGITLYAYTDGLPFGARTDVYGLFEASNPGMQFPGYSLAQLPPPWEATNQTLDAIGTLLYANVPLWRRFVTLEAGNVNQSEFTVPETIAPAAAATGALMGAGWSPSSALKSRGPRPPAQLKESLWYQP